MNAKPYNQLPHDTNFIGVHSYNGQLWSGTYRIVAGVLERYSESLDDFEKSDDAIGICDTNDITFYTV